VKMDVSHLLNPKAMDVGDESEYMFDIGNLELLDPSPVHKQLLKADCDGHLLSLARERVQCLFSKVFALPYEELASGISGGSGGRLARLPAPTQLIPREKPIPKVKEATRWEKFAKAKGIGPKKKRDRMVFDEGYQDYRPRYGYKKANNEEDEHNWAIEAAPGKDFEDPFEKLLSSKKDRTRKNMLQRKRNKEEGAGPASVALTSHGLPLTSPTQHTLKGGKSSTESKRVLNSALRVARSSTASIGKFDSSMQGEPKLLGKKRKFEPVVEDSAAEKTKNQRVLDRVLGQAASKSPAKSPSKPKPNKPARKDKKREGRRGGGPPAKKRKTK